MPIPMTPAERASLKVPSPPVTPPSPFDDDGAADVPDFGQLLLKITGGNVEQGKTVTGLQGLGLSLAESSPLSLTPLEARANPLSLDTVTTPDKYNPMQFQWEYGGKKVNSPNDIPTSGGSYGGRPKGGFGPGAYGFTGTTGLKGSKGSSPYGFQTPMWNALRAAQNAMAAAGLGKFGITDGWRSYESQVALKAKKGDLAATPGRSVHGLGLAADISLNSKQLAWLKKNGAKFGLVNLPSESWHWQYDPSLWRKRK